MWIATLLARHRLFGYLGRACFVLFAEFLALERYFGVTENKAARVADISRLHPDVLYPDHGNESSLNFK